MRVAKYPNKFVWLYLLEIMYVYFSLNLYAISSELMSFKDVNW